MSELPFNIKISLGKEVKFNCPVKIKDKFEEFSNILASFDSDKE